MNPDLAWMVKEVEEEVEDDDAEFADEDGLEGVERLVGDEEDEEESAACSDAWLETSWVSILVDCGNNMEERPHPSKCDNNANRNERMNACKEKSLA
jgi:hypothetical protein